MEMIPITDERMAQLAEFAHRRGQDTAAALDVALGEFLAWESKEFAESVAGLREGYGDLKAGRTQTSEAVFENLRTRHGLSR